MKKQQLVSAVSVLLNRGQDDNTAIFINGNHDNMVRELQNYIEMNKSHLGGNVILNFTQAMNDHGVDLILEIPDRVKIGFQIKSHYDVTEDTFAANVKRQFAESFAHGLDKWILIICAPLHDGIKNREPRIAHLINEMSMFKTNVFAIYNPRHAAALFQQMNALSDTDFNAEYQKLANIEDSEAETLKLLQKLLNTDQSTARSYLSRWSIATATLPKTLSRMNEVLKWNLSEDELKITLDSCISYLKRLENLTPQWYYPLLVDKRKKTSVKMDLILPNEGDFFMAKKGQTFRRYSLELKLEAVRLVNKEHMSIREVAKRLDIQNTPKISECK